MKAAYLPAVITRPPRLAAQVDRLIKHCLDLDGTKLTVLEDNNTEQLSPENTAARALHIALKQFAGRPFLWLEPDSPPIKAGWLAAISAEYKKVGKPFLIPDLSKCETCDFSSGIGVYPGEAHYLIPKSFPEWGWDKWLEKHMAPVIGRTRLIQHRYGRYFEGAASPWEFPRDQSILEPETVIFHKDAGQTLLDCFNDSPYQLDFTRAIPERKPGAVRWRHCGDIGDCIAALPILRAMGGGDVVLFHDPDAPKGMSARESLEGKRYEIIKPLLEAQPYVHSVSWGQNISIKECGFRETLRPKHESLLERQARHVNMWPLDQSPWLTIPGEIKAHDRIVCYRSPRYHNSAFPWADVAETYGDRLLFVGLEEEHKAFEETLKRNVEWAQIETFLDIARILAGAKQVIGNQTSIAWVALGLGVKLILEGLPAFPNTEIPRAQNFYAYTPEHMQTLRRAFANARARR